MPAAPPLAKFSLISSYSSKNVWLKFAQPSSQNDLQFFLLLVGGGCILPISRCQAIHAIGYPFGCPSILCLTLFPNINQTPKQNYPSQLEKIARYPKENVREAFLNTYPCANLAYNVISAYLIIW